MIGKSISHYKILEKLGEGGMGVVYKAEDTKLKRAVALKFLSSHLTADSEAKKRFIREARTASSLDHPNICTIHEINETEEGQLFIVMAFYEGESLKEKLSKGRLEKNESNRIIQQISRGLSAAHTRGIYHRDIKPANIFITAEGLVKILDFGLAKLSGQSGLTQTGTTAGTMAYMSPEQIQSGAVDQRSDIWSMAVVYYEMLTGETPFHGEYAQAVMYAILEKEPDLHPVRFTDATDELTLFFKKSLSKNPGDRFDSVDEMIEYLFPGESEAIYRSGHPPIFWKTGSTWKLVVAVFLVLILSMAYFLASANMSGSPGTPIRVAVLDTENKTGDPNLDGVSDYIITGLEQSEKLKVFSRYQLFDRASNQGMQIVNRISEHIGYRIFTNGGADAMAVPVLQKIGRRYVLDMKVVDPVTKNHLFIVQERCGSRDAIPSAIDRLVMETRKNFRESDRVIGASSIPVAELSTENIEAQRHYFRGEEHYINGNYHDAEIEFRKAVALDSTYGMAYFRLACMKPMDAEITEANLFQKALRYIEHIPERYRYLLRARHKVAYSELSSEGAAESLRILEEMQKRFPEDKEMLYEMGKCLNRLDRRDEALEKFRRVLSLDPTFEPALVSVFWATVRSDDYEQAEKLGNQLARVNPVSGNLWLAVLFKRHTKNYEKAEFYYKKALEHNPNHDMTLNGLMQLAWVQKNYDLMLDMAEKLIRVGNLEFRIRNAAGAYAIAGKFDDGLDILNEALNSEHHNPDYHYYIWRAKVDLLAFAGRFHDALSESALMMARSDTPQDRRLACDALLNSYLYLGKFRDAIHVIDQVIEIHEGENLGTWILKNLARKAVYIQWGWADHDSATTIIEKTLEAGKAREYYQYRIFLFSYYANRGGIAKAEQEIEGLEFHENMIPVLRGDYDTAVQKASAYRKRVMGWVIYPIWRYEIAKYYLQNNLYDKALAQLDTMNTMYCSQYGYRAVFYPRSFYLRGQIHEAAGELSLAIENYQKLLDIWKDGDQDLIVLMDTKRRLNNIQSSRL